MLIDNGISLVDPVDRVTPAVLGEATQALINGQFFFVCSEANRAALLAAPHLYIERLQHPETGAWFVPSAGDVREDLDGELRLRPTKVAP